MDAQRMQHIPRKEPAIVAIREDGLDRVVANRFDAEDLDVALADLQGLLTGGVPACFGGRREDAQELIAELITPPFSNASSRIRDFWCSLISVGIGVSELRPAMSTFAFW